MRHRGTAAAQLPPPRWLHRDPGMPSRPHVARKSWGLYGANRPILNRGRCMTRKAQPADQPDAVLICENGGRWTITCLLCPRTLANPASDNRVALYRAKEHLQYSHALFRIWVEEHPHGYKKIVQDALPLIVAHDMQVASEYRR